MAPDGVKKRISDSPAETCPFRAEVPGILVIEGLHREHDAALDQVLPNMRRIAFRQSLPSLTPLAWPIAQLVEGRADPRVNQVIDSNKCRAS